MDAVLSFPSRDAFRGFLVDDLPVDPHSSVPQSLAALASWFGGDDRAIRVRPRNVGKSGWGDPSVGRFPVDWIGPDRDPPPMTFPQALIWAGYADWLEEWRRHVGPPGGELLVHALRSSMLHFPEALFASGPDLDSPELRDMLWRALPESRTQVSTREWSAFLSALMSSGFDVMAGSLGSSPVPVPGDDPSSSPGLLAITLPLATIAAPGFSSLASAQSHEAPLPLFRPPGVTAEIRRRLLLCCRSSGVEPPEWLRSPLRSTVLDRLPWNTGAGLVDPFAVPLLSLFVNCPDRAALLASMPVAWSGEHRRLLSGCGARLPMQIWIMPREVVPRMSSVPGLLHVRPPRCGLDDLVGAHGGWLADPDPWIHPEWFICRWLTDQGCAPLTVADLVEIALFAGHLGTSGLGRLMSLHGLFTDLLKVADLDACHMASARLNGDPEGLSLLLSGWRVDRAERLPEMDRRAHAVFCELVLRWRAMLLDRLIEFESPTSLSAAAALFDPVAGSGQPVAGGFVRIRGS